MGKNKIARWAELATFNNVIQPEPVEVSGKDHWIKGNWNLKIFKNKNPIILELGCGKGEYTTGLAMLFPGCNFIGVDIKGARMWRGAKSASEIKIGNVAFLRTRIEFIDSFFVSGEVDEIWITFPDPHPGKKNSNKRLTCPWFLNKYSNLLKEGGTIHLKTDNTELYHYTRKLAEDNGLEILFSTNDIHSMSTNDLEVFCNMLPYNDDPRNKNRASAGILSIRTYYETKFLEKGHTINYLAFRPGKNKKVSHGWEKTEGE